MNNNDSELKIQNVTKRLVISDLEEILYRKIPVLDHGFIKVMDYMGGDNSIVQAARVSYGRGTKKLSQDRNLINYLMRHSHTTPFEMCEIKFHIKLPIFIARQWIRHRTASVNEYSARYSILTNEFYVPKKIDLCTQSTINKQGRSTTNVPYDIASKVISLITEDSEKCYKHYMEMINEDEQGNIINEDSIGITRELARINLTLNHYTEWYWKINLHNLFHFLTLRVDSHAQYEIRMYAQIILDIVKVWVPYAYEAFMEHIVHSTKISKTGMEVIRKMLKGHVVEQNSSNMSKREWSELMSILQDTKRNK